MPPAVSPAVSRDGRARGTVREDEDEDENERSDVFYPAIIDWAVRVRVNVVLMEVADLEQAGRVAGVALGVRGGAGGAGGVGGAGGGRGGYFRSVEIWRDDPGAECGEPGEVDVRVGGEGGTVKVGVKGCGNGRSVVCWR